jgi:hypothetical protein
VVETVVDYDSPSALRGTEVFDVHGKRVDPLTFLRMQKKWRAPVLISYTGTVDPFYLQVVKEETFIIVLGTRDGAEDKVRKLYH